MKALTLFAVLVTAAAENADVLMPHKLAPAICANGCASWSDLASSYNNFSQDKANAMQVVHRPS